LLKSGDVYRISTGSELSTGYSQVIHRISTGPSYSQDIHRVRVIHRISTYSQVIHKLFTGPSYSQVIHRISTELSTGHSINKI
jgi:hypothetical protein